MSNSGTSSPVILFATLIYAIPAKDFSSFTTGSPLFVEVIMFVSSGITPIKSQDKITAEANPEK